MRVIAGEAKGRKLRSVPGRITRPITDRVKESLFNIVVREVVNAFFLDLFAGTGSVGIEALSRGARRAVFVEWNRQALKVIAKNLETTGLADRAQVVRSDVFKFLKKEFDEKFDIVYIAPPQYKGLWAKTLLALDGRELLANEGLAIAQIHPKEFASLDLKSLQLADQRQYGSTLLCFYTRLATGR
jgi:16S rRNA (guanine(966)-N(2))-methyltransferase RsmD